MYSAVIHPSQVCCDMSIWSMNADKLHFRLDGLPEDKAGSPDKALGRPKKYISTPPKTFSFWEANTVVKMTIFGGKFIAYKKLSPPKGRLNSPCNIYHTL